MTDLIIENCPLCGRRARFYFRDGEKKKRFSCPSCSEFVISNRAQRRTEVSSAALRETLSREARAAQSGKILLIRMPPVGGENSEIPAREYQTLSDW